MFLLCISCSDPQKESDKKIDSLIQKAHNGMVTLEYLKTIKYAKEAESFALKTNNKKKLPYIYLELAHGFSSLEFQKESFTYLNKIMTFDFDKKPKEFKARVNHIYSWNYMELGLGKQALEYNRKNVLLLKNSKDSVELKHLAQTYEDIAFHYYAEEITDSSFHYFNKQKNILRKFPEKETFLSNATIYSIKGYLFLEQKKQKDSARLYFQKALALRKKYNDHYLDREYLGLGECSFLEGDYNKALEYYLKAEKNIQEKNAEFNENNDINQVLAKVYEALNDTEKQTYYLKKNKQFNDSLKVAHKQNTDEAVSLMMNKKTEENTSVKKNYTALLIVILIALSVTGIFIYRYFKKRKIDSDKTEELLVEKEILLSQKEEETQDLRQKINESFEEVVQLAKDNHPEFLTRFNEVYPEFSKKLLLINPSLVASELKFCAMIFLNFVTKDIAEYTFTSPKTVQNRKNSLRKKLNISSDEDLYVWFKNF
jgi:tetratricopeptide (TPR) repeat protein